MTSTQYPHSALYVKELVCQENGQRRFGGPPPGWQGAPPSRGTEVFVGKLPRRIDEAVLWAFVNEPGRVYELRIMIDFSGDNRGFAFVVYATKEEAKNAVAYLNNREIVPNRRVGCVPSVDNRRLFVGGLPRDKMIEDVKRELRQLVDGVCDVILYPSATDKSKNRGFAFVEFEQHRQAALARQKLTRDKLSVWGQQLCVDWAEPEQDVDESTMNQVRILYVRNLMLSTDENTMRAAFERVTPGCIEKVKKIKDFGFVHFTTREAAEQARATMHESILEGALLEVIWAKPPDRTIMKFVRNSIKNGTQLPTPTTPGVNATVGAPTSAAPLLLSPYAMNVRRATHASPPPITQIPLSTPLFQHQLSASEWAYTGSPLIDTSQITRLVNTTTGVQQSVGQRLPSPSSDRVLTRLARGAAGTRGVGFQSYINNQMRRTRRRYAETVPDMHGHEQPTATNLLNATAYTGVGAQQPMHDPTAYYFSTFGTPVDQMTVAAAQMLYQQALANELTQIAVNSSAQLGADTHTQHTSNAMSLSTSPTNTANNHATAKTGAVEMLANYCAARALGEPAYEQMSTEEGYVYKVLIPGLLPFIADRAFTLDAPARQYAALYALVYLGEVLSPRAQQRPTDMYTTLPPPFVGTASFASPFTFAPVRSGDQTATQSLVYVPNGLLTQ